MAMSKFECPKCGKTAQALAVLVWHRCIKNQNRMTAYVKQEVDDE